MPAAKVQRVVQQPLVVGAHIQRDRDHPARIDARRGGVDGQLADRDLDTADTPVADAQDLLGVAAHDQVDIPGSQPQRAERLFHVIRPVDGQVDAPRSAVLVRVAFDGIADHRIVDDGKQLGQVIEQYLEVQHLVAVVQLLHVDVLRQVAALDLQLPVGTLSLLVQRQHRGRQAPGQAQDLAFGRGERHSAVAERSLRAAGMARVGVLLSVT